MEPILKVQNVQKFYGRKQNITRAVDGISFNVNKGEYIGIMGASGSGKTTLLNCISTIDTVTSGTILIGGKDITSLRKGQLSKFRREELGFIFQDFNLLDTLTAYENIALALTILKVRPADVDVQVRGAAQKLGISDILSKFPSELSGGQKQRVACARAIVTNPSLILADEPTGALDSKSARMLLQYFDRMVEEMGATILMVTHDAMSASYCERIVFIKDGTLFTELVRGEDSRKVFFDRIIEVVTLLGGDQDVY
jgi:putative ABC transport system ATP-binding protein